MSVQSACTGPSDEFAMGYVRGLRSWDVLDDGTLQSISREVNWEDGTNVAECVHVRWQHYHTSEDHGPHPADPSCSCGFYAYYDGSIFRLGGILGIIDGFGHVTVGTKGFRSEKAQIRALCLAKPRLIPATDRIIAFVLGINLFAIVFGFFSGPRTIGSTLFSIGCGLLFAVGMGMRITDVRKGKISRRNADDMYQKIQAKYPSAEVFTSYRKMVKAYTPHNGGLGPKRKFRWLKNSIYRSLTLS